jgi:hypothetical protein
MAPGFRAAFLQFPDLHFVFFGELEQALFGERIGTLCETAAAFCLLPEEIDIHDAIGYFEGMNVGPLSMFVSKSSVEDLKRKGSSVHRIDANDG